MGLLTGTPSNPQLPTGLYTILLIDVSSSVNMTLFKQIQAFIEQMVNGKSQQIQTFVEQMAKW